MRKRLHVAAALTALTVSNAALAEPSPTPACPELDREGTSFSSIKALPWQITSELARKMPGLTPEQPLIADRDQPWQVTDTVTPGSRLPYRRFIHAGSVGRRWYIWYESGGIVHSFSVAIIEFPDTGQSAKAITHRFAMPDRMCTVTRDHLADPIPETEPEHDIW